MPPDISKGSLGPEGSYDLAFASGKLQVSASYQGKQAGAQLTLMIDGGALLEVLAQAVSNPTEKLLIEGLKAIVESIP